MVYFVLHFSKRGPPFGPVSYGFSFFFSFLCSRLQISRRVVAVDVTPLGTKVTSCGRKYVINKALIGVVTGSLADGQTNGALWTTSG